IADFGQADLPSNIGNLRNLQLLHLESSNSLHLTEQMFAELSSVKTIVLKASEINIIPNSLFESEELESLSIIADRIDNWRIVHTDCPNLSSLTIQINKHEKLPEALAHLHHLNHAS